MATMFAYQAFDYRSLNLNDLIAKQTDFEFNDDLYYSFNGITYEDVVYFEHYSDGYVGSFFGGTGITFNSDQSEVTGGTVTGYFEEYGDGGNWVDAWLVQNFAYSAVRMAEAAYSSGTADDFAVIAGILGGNDSIRLSPYGDLVRGYGGNDQIFGNGGNDLLYGDAGADTLDGGAGSDTLLGGAGNDTYIVANVGDRVYETTTLGGTTNAGGTDTVRSSVNHALGSYVENLVLAGSSAINGTGNGLANRLTGNAAANVLDGRGGADTMLGGRGNDVYYVDNLGDRVYETTTVGGSTDAGGTDTVRSSVNHALGSYVENLVLTGSGSISGTGNGLANRLTGNAAANILNGGGGSDTLLGGGGSDRLAGGAGGDKLSGGGGADRFTFTSKVGSDTVTDFLSGTDKLAFSQAGLKVGDGDVVVEGAVVRAAAGGFASSAELVIFSSNVASLTATSAAAAIGSATSAMATGKTALFAVDNGTASALYLFTSADGNAAVSSGELALLATLGSTPATAVSDYLFLA